MRVDPPLAEQGIDELKALVADYPYPLIQKLFVSPALRCRMTAELVYPNRQCTVVDALREMDFGEWEGLAAKDVQRLPYWQNRFVQGEAFTMPGGESFGQVTERMIAAVGQILAAADGYETIGVVTHSLAIKRLFTATLKTPLSESEAFCPNGMGYLVEVDPEEWLQTHRLNFVALLPQGAPRPDMSESPYIARQ